MSPFVEPGKGFMGCSHPDRGAVARKLAAPLTAEHQQQLAAASPGTIFFPDVSNYQGGLKIAAGTAAVLAKATEADSYTDPWYGNFKAQAAQRGSVFGAYHFQWSASSSEVHHVYSVVGRTPLMMDVENTSRALHIADVVNFVNAYRSLGGVVHLAYIPRWYWQGTMGSPSLVPLQQLGVYVVSSNYTTYSDSGPGWAAYGGVVPRQWQYTDALAYGGMRVDFNAFRGSAADYRALLTGSTPAPTNITPEDDDMITFVQEARVAGDVGGAKHGKYAAVWKAEAGWLDHLSPQDFADAQYWASHNWKNGYAGAAVQVIDPGHLGAFGALRPGTGVPDAGEWSGRGLRGYVPPAATVAGDRPHECDEQCDPNAPEPVTA